MKKRFILSTALCLLGCFVLSGSEFISQARWIWGVGDRKPVSTSKDPNTSNIVYEKWAPEKVYLRRVIDVKEPLKRAYFYAFADKKGTFYLNGKKIALRPWNELPPSFGHVRGHGIDLSKMLKKGRNVLAVELSRTNSGAFGLILKGEIQYLSGKKEYIFSNADQFKGSDKAEENWNTISFDDSKWKKVHEQGDVTMRPWMTYGNVPLLYCTAEEYAAYAKNMTAGFPDTRIAEENKGKFQARIVYRNHIPGIEVNGKIIPPFTTTVSTVNPDSDTLIRETGKAGMQIIRLAGFNPLTANGDYTTLDLRIRKALANNPEAYILLGFRETGTAKWMKQHPDELAGYAVKSNRKGEYWGNHDTPSLASQLWLKEIEKSFRDMADYCLKQPWAGRILGIIVSGGGSGDGMPFGAYCMPDTGKRMTEEFRRYLTEKYKTDEALQKSWNDSTVTLATAKVPDMLERRGSDMFLRDPGNALDRRVIDYYDCYHRCFSNYIIYQMKAFKKYFPGRLAGCYYGYTLLRYPPEGQTARFEEVLKSPYVDIMFATTLGYNLSDGLHRQSTSVFHRYGKLASIEADIRTHTDKSALKKWQCKSPEETRATVSKVIANSFLYGTGYHLVPFNKSYIFNNPESLEPIQAGVNIWKKLFAAPPEKKSDIAVILDHDQVWKQGHPDRIRNGNFLDLLLIKPLQSLYFSGFSFDMLALDDFIASKHKYRCVIFLNCFEITAAQRSALMKKLRRNGVTAVWNYAPGLIKNEKFSSQSMSDITGIKLQVTKKMLPFYAVDAQQIQLAPPGKIINNAPRVHSIDPAGEKLFTYSDTTGALVRKKLAGGSTAVFAGIPVTSHTLWSKLLADAGCHKYTEPGFMVRSSSKLLMVFSIGDGNIAPESVFSKDQVNRSGKLTVTVDCSKTQMKELFTGKVYKVTNGKLHLTNTNGRPQCWLFEK